MQEEGNLLQLAAAILSRPASTSASASGSDTSSAATVTADKAAAETEEAAASSAEASRAPAPPTVASQPQTLVQVTITGSAACLKHTCNLLCIVTTMVPRLLFPCSCCFECPAAEPFPFFPSSTYCGSSFSGIKCADLNKQKQ